MRKQVWALYGLVLMTLIVIAFTIWAPITKGWVKQVIAEQLSTYLETPVKFTDVHFGFLPPSIEFQEIEFHKQNNPLEHVYAGRIKLTLGLSPSISGRVRIKNIEIDQPILKFNFSNIKFDNKEKKEKKKFRLPTLRDLLKVQIDQIQISKTALSMEFPGKYFVEMDSETAGYRRDKKNEFWSWKGEAVARKGKSAKKIERMEITAKRSGQKIDIQHMMIKGEQNLIMVEGQAYPEANLEVKIAGYTSDLLEVLDDMDLIKQKVDLTGNYRLESKLIGPWDDLNQDGKLELKSINFGGRKFDRLFAGFQVRKNQLKNIEGSLEVNTTKVEFGLSGIEQNNRAQFTVKGTNVNYGDVQRSIDPTVEPILRSLLNVEAKGTIQAKPFQADGNYQVRGQQMVFDFPPILTPYLPLELKQIEAEGVMKWNAIDGCKLEGPIRTAGMNGTYKFLFPEPAVVDGTWDFNISQFGSLFTKDYPVVGKGKINGGLKANHGELKANFLLDIKDLQYAKHEKSSLTGDLIFTDKGTHISKIQIQPNNKRGIANFDGEFGHGEEGYTTLQGKAENFNLSWISALASRRFPFVAGIQGRGTTSVSMKGPNENVIGTVLLTSDNLDWKGEHLDSVDAKLRVTEAGLDIEELKLVAEEFKVGAQGKIVNDQYQNFAVSMNKVPVSLLGLPSWISQHVNRVDGGLNLNGPLDDPQILVTGQMYQPNADATVLSNAGTFSAKGTAKKMDYEIDAFEKKFRSKGIVQFGDHIFIDATGEMEKFNILPQTNSFITGKWNFAGDVEQLKTWNGLFSVSAVEIRNNKFIYKSKTPFELTAQNGVFNLTPFKLGEKDSDVLIKGHTDAEENLYFTMKGKMPIALLTLLPLKLTRAEGLADVDIAYTGKLRNPVLNGKFHAVNAYVQDQLFPHAIEDLELIADIEQNRVKARTIKGRMADGVLEGRGDLFLPTANSEMKIFLTGSIDQAWLRFPEWLPVLVSGNFILDGPLAKPLLKGDFTILEGTYKDEWDWKKQVLTIGRNARTARIYRKEDEGLQYDLSFRSDNGKFILRNQVASATMKGDLRIMGTNENVGMLGQIEILEGEVVFLDRKFRLLPGVVNFTNPTGINMGFDLNATTNIDNVDIYLDIRTEQDEIRAYLSSNPVKDETTIIALLTLGVELNDLAVAQSADQGMSLSILPSVLSGPVQSRVETGLRKIKLIDTFQFIPYFSENTKTTSMRLLVAKQLFSKVRLSYSTDLFDTGLDNTFALEQLLNNNVKLMGSVRDNRMEAEQDYDLGFDVEFRFDF